MINKNQKLDRVTSFNKYPSGKTMKIANKFKIRNGLRLYCIKNPKFEKINH